MPITWLDAEFVVDLNRIALDDSEPHALNPDVDLQGAVHRPKTH